MKKVEVTTAHNVTIEYELATVMERFISLIIDLSIMWGSIGILSLFFSSIFSFSSQTISFLVITPIFLFYTLISEVFWNGQSIGKRALKIRVIKLSGEKADFFDYLLRWTFRMVDLYLSLGTVAVLSASTSNKTQRLGDFLSDMVVIKINSANRIQLKTIQKLNKLDNYTPEFPEIKNLEEHDMLIIKEVLERFQKYPNEGNKKLLLELITQIKEKLNITSKKNPTDFINTLIKDYVALTR